MENNDSTARRHNTRLRARARIPFWLSLPLEIRLMILAILAQDKHPGWSTHASVCREWQHTLARANLRKLKLGSSCLDEFGRVITMQKDFVRHIWLNIELQPYTCRECGIGPNICSGKDEKLIATAVQKIFLILSKWKPRDGLALELNAYSPSDNQHCFKGFYFATDDQGGAEDELAPPEGHDPRHGWDNGRKVEASSKSATLRLFPEMVIDFDDEELPRVQAVTRLIIRRQLRRKLHYWSLRSILDKLCRLQHMVYEPWRGWERIWTLRAYTERHLLVQKGLPATLRTLTLFEDFDENIAETLSGSMSWNWNEDVSRYPIPNPGMGAAVASRSLKLEHLSASFIADARDFVDSCSMHHHWTWRKLETLALTTRLFQKGTSHQVINDLLLEASMIAARMPKLRTLVLWNGGRGNACAFIFQAGKGKDCDLITWRGTWNLEISPRVEQGWARVSSRIQSCPLRVTKEVIRGEVRSHGDAIHLLNLPCQVVEPASLWQIRREGALTLV